MTFFSTEHLQITFLALTKKYNSWQSDFEEIMHVVIGVKFEP